MPMNNHAFAQAIKGRRNELGLTQLDLAAKGGPSDTTQRRIEAGELFNISQSTLRKYDRGFGWAAGAAAKLPARPSTVKEPTTREFGKFWNAVMDSLRKHTEGLTFDQRNVIASQAWFELHPEMRPTDGRPTDAVIFVGHTEGTSK